MSRILVTGGAGFIGSHTVDALLEHGHDVRVLDTLEPPVHTALWPAYLAADVELMRGSVTDPTAFRRALNEVDAVFHLAAYQDYLTDFSHFFQTNSVSTALLYEIIVNERLPIQKIVVASSQAIYGEGKYRCDMDDIQYPDQRPAPQLQGQDWNVRCPKCSHTIQPQWTDERVSVPHNSYAFSKRDQDEISTKLGRRYNIPSVAMRYSIVQGPRQSFRNAYSGALRSFTVRVLGGQQPVLYEDGCQLRDYVSIHDVVRANLLVLEEDRANYQAFNVGADRRVSVHELADLVIRAAGAKVEPNVSGMYRVGDTRHVFSDVSKLKTLGWNPQVSQEAIVREYVEWAAEQPDVNDTFSEAQQQMHRLGVLRESSPNATSWSFAAAARS